MPGAECLAFGAKGPTLRVDAFVVGKEWNATMLSGQKQNMLPLYDPTTLFLMMPIACRTISPRSTMTRYSKYCTVKLAPAVKNGPIQR